MHTQSLRGYHNTPLSWVPRSPYLMLPSWDLQGGDQSPLLPIGLRSPDLGLAPDLYLILWPFLVSWSVPSMSLVRAQPSRELEHHSKRAPRIPSGITPPCLSRGPLFWHGWATSPAAQGASVVGISLGSPEMLQKPVLEKPSTTLRELENSGSLHRWAQRS